MNFLSRYKWVILLSVILIPLIILVASMFETYEDEIETGFQGKARLNRYLAIEHFFKEMGLPAKSQASLKSWKLSEEYDLGLLVAPVRSLPTVGNEFEILRDWVYDGNMLITGDTLDLEESRKGISYDFRELLGIQSQEKLEVYKMRHKTEISFQAKKYEINVRPRSLLKSKHSAQTCKDDSGNTLMHKHSYGDGAVIFINDFTILENAYIDEYDHAGLLWEMTQCHQYDMDYAKVVYLRNFNSIWTWFWENGKPIILLSTILILAFIIKYGLVNGPRLPLPELRRYQLMAHIRACARFQWQNNPVNRTNSFLDYLRKDISEILQKKHPVLAAKPYSEVMQDLAQLSDIDENLLKDAFLTRNQTAHEFTHAVRTLQKLRETL